MSKATLSGIENGRANPTVDTLAALAAALRVSVAELLDEPTVGEVRVVRAARARYEQRDGIARRLLEAGDPGASPEVVEIVLGPSEKHEVGPGPDGGRVGVFVIDGPLVAGPVERSTELGAGDFMSFPADAAHVYAAGRRPVRALLLTQAAA
jgi:transcriptional regulator with XRE-family HTH domain